MNCQEVMEYMQRELDGDLGPFESAKAHEHIRQCADCSAMYERLKRLSAELENLPKVTPPISLVDAILPKLDEIDRVKAAASADAGSPELAGAAGTAARTLPRRRSNRFSLRILSGVVAAGVVAGVFIVMNDSDRFDDSFSGSTAVMDSSGSSGSMLMMSSASESAGAQVTQKAANVGEVTDQDAPGSGADPSGDSIRQPADDHAGYGFTGSDADAGSGVNSGSGSGEDRLSPPAMLGEAGEGPGVSEPGEWPEDDGRLGITGIVDQYGPVESVSPDGSYTAVFSDSRVVIYDRDGVARFEGEAREGAIAAFGWSEDGAFFRYEVRLDDGTGAIYRIDPASGTETRE